MSEVAIHQLVNDLKHETSSDPPGTFYDLFCTFPYFQSSTYVRTCARVSLVSFLINSWLLERYFVFTADFAV